uniref:R3H-associated N-terminal domain-containing protein n=1 Tax=Davidia involucrata TaxID=16924 RepID=A0A5B7CAP7_DAVIN
MATPEGFQSEQDLLLSSPLFEHPKGENAKSRGLAIEKKIEFLESLTGKVSNRRSRRWLNDRLLMELVPRLNAEEIRGLFAPPPWGDDVPLSPFCMTNVGEWDKFRNIDMDKEVFHFSYSPNHVSLPHIIPDILKEGKYILRTYTAFSFNLIIEENTSLQYYFLQFWIWIRVNFLCWIGFYR